MRSWPLRQVSETGRDRERERERETNNGKGFTSCVRAGGVHRHTWETWASLNPVRGLEGRLSRGFPGAHTHKQASKTETCVLGPLCTSRVPVHSHQLFPNKAPALRGVGSRWGWSRSRHGRCGTSARPASSRRSPWSVQCWRWIEARGRLKPCGCAAAASQRSTACSFTDLPALLAETIA